MQSPVKDLEGYIGQHELSTPSHTGTTSRRTKQDIFTDLVDEVVTKASLVDREFGQLKRDKLTRDEMVSYVQSHSHLGVSPQLGGKNKRTLEILYLEAAEALIDLPPLHTLGADSRKSELQQFSDKHSLNIALTPGKTLKELYGTSIRAVMHRWMGVQDSFDSAEQELDALQQWLETQQWGTSVNCSARRQLHNVYVDVGNAAKIHFGKQAKRSLLKQLDDEATEEEDAEYGS